MQSRYLEPIHNTSVVDEIVERLVGLIVDEGLKPGDKLMSERELIARLGVGRSSLREAIKTLCALGVLETRRGTGTFVGYGDTSILTKPLAWGLFVNQTNIQHVIEARSVVEIALAGWAAERATTEDIAKIGQILEQMDAVQDDMDTYVDLDLKFHLAIAHAADNEMMAGVLGIFQHVLRVWMETTYVESGGTKDSMELHHKIYDAIRNSDVAQASELMADHTSGGPLLSAAARAYAKGLPPPPLI
jgi:GntR family transcriptional repressor for pyruvate dehydrogenase complex